MSGRPEQELQRAVAAFLDATLLPPALYTAFPAGGGGRVRGAVLNGMGLHAGWPDIQILHADRYHGIELKSPRGRLSPEQREMLRRINAAGGLTCVARSLDEVIEQLREWGIPLRRHHLRRQFDCQNESISQ